MDSLDHAANTASRAVFSDSKDTSEMAERQSGIEPVSGVTGAGKPDEPYDAGNTEGDSNYRPSIDDRECVPLTLEDG